MRTKFLLFCLTILLAAVVSARAQKEPVYKPAQAEVISAAQFTVMKVGKKIPACRRSLKACAFDAMAAVGLEGFGGPEGIYFFENQFTYLRDGKSVGVFLFSILNREENPSSDERTRVEFVRDKNAWHFVRIGQQSRCVNGKRTTKWSKAECR